MAAVGVDNTRPGRASNQIQLTVAESNRLKNLITARLGRCTSQTGRPRQSRERRDLVSLATQSALMQDMSPNPEPGMGVRTSDGDTIVALPVGDVYAPSTVPLGELTPIRIADLRIHTRHVGRSLAVKKCGAEVPAVGFVWTVVEDAPGQNEVPTDALTNEEMNGGAKGRSSGHGVNEGQVERLEIYLHQTKRGADALDGGPEYIIKEPYFTINEQGEATLRINHPSDLVRVGDSAKLERERTTLTQEKCKTRGNAALKKGENVEAAEHYTQGLKLALEATEDGKEQCQDLVYDLHRNRALVNLTLGRLDEAKADGIAAVTGDGTKTILDCKANVRAATAAYNLREYEEAQRLFKAALALCPDDKESSTYLRNIEARLKEQATGIYDFDRLRAKVTPANPRVNAASFTANTVVKSSPCGGGRGLFASRDMDSNDLVLCEKAFLVTWAHEDHAWTAMTCDMRDDRIRAFPAGLAQQTVQKLLNNPSLIPSVMSLYADHAPLGSKIYQAEDGPVVDTFTVHDLTCRNAFGCGGISSGGNYGAEDARRASTGIWVHTAYTNHSCLPNCTKEFIGDLVVVRAMRPIAAGEELTLQYAEGIDYEARQAMLQTTWGFKCECKLCRAEASDSAEVKEKRRELFGQAVEFAGRNKANGAKRLIISSAERLAKAVNETYDDKRYDGLPRTCLQPIQGWLDIAKKRRDT